MKIKPSEPDEHGVRWCSNECPQFLTLDDSVVTVCGVHHGQALHDHACIPWMREVVRCGKAFVCGTAVETLDAIIRMEELLGDGEVEVGDE